MGSHPSVHHATKNGYYIKPARWLGEMMALKYLIDTQRPNFSVVRYEDLVTSPSVTQSKLASNLGLEIDIPAIDYMNSFAAPEKANAAMHGIRKIDTKSVNRWKSDPKYQAYLKTILPRLGETLNWMASTFNYDVRLKLT